MFILNSVTAVTKHNQYKIQSRINFQKQNEHSSVRRRLAVSNRLNKLVKINASQNKAEPDNAELQRTLHLNTNVKGLTTRMFENRVGESDQT